MCREEQGYYQSNAEEGFTPITATGFLKSCEESWEKAIRTFFISSVALESFEKNGYKQLLIEECLAGGFTRIAVCSKIDNVGYYIELEGVSDCEENR